MRRTFLGEIESRVATRETFRPSRSQTLGMINSAKLLGDLLKGLVSNCTLRPRAQRWVNASGAKDASLQRLQIVPRSIGMNTFRQPDRLVIASARGLQVAEESITVGQPLPDIGVGQKAAVLGLPGEFDRFLGKILSETRVVAWLPAHLGRMSIARLRRNAEGRVDAIETSAQLKSSVLEWTFGVGGAAQGRTAAQKMRFPNSLARHINRTEPQSRKLKP